MFLEIVGIIALTKICLTIDKIADEIEDFVENLDEAQETPNTSHEETMHEE